MAVVHTFFMNLIMRTYAYAEYAIENNDLPDFLGFCDVALSVPLPHTTSIISVSQDLKLK